MSSIKPTAPEWRNRSTAYIGSVDLCGSTWRLFDCTHFEVRAEERHDDESDRVFAAKIEIADILEEHLSSNQVLLHCLCRNAARKVGNYIRATRYQWVNRLQHNCFVFEIRPSYREIYLVTFYKPREGYKDVKRRANHVVIDLDEQSKVTVLDLRNHSRRVLYR